MDQRPNILFLMSDQHRADITGYEGNSVVRTPVLDELARTGVVFRNAYTPSPVCVPARQCMTAGQLPKTCGCEGWIDLPPDYMTFPKRFSQFAYNTVCSGKLHHLGPDQMQGWTKRIAPDAEISTANIAGRLETEFDRYEAQTGTGKWSNQKELERAGIAFGPCQEFDREALRASRQFVGRYFTDPYYDRPQGHRPLLLKMSLLQPHYPFFSDEEKFTYYHNRVSTYIEPVPYRQIPMVEGVRPKKIRHERPKGFPWRKDVLYNCLCKTKQSTCSPSHIRDAFVQSFQLISFRKSTETFVTL